MVMRHTAVGPPQANPNERGMKEISCYFLIYCSETHRKWAELIPHIQSWLKNTVTSATGFTPAELNLRARDPTI